MHSMQFIEFFMLTCKEEEENKKIKIILWKNIHNTFITNFFSNLFIAFFFCFSFFLFIMNQQEC